jgi:DNA-binding response OmpR family regulator
MLKIGIVEDDLLIAESITVALTQIGYSTTAIARSYNEALKMIQQEQPDLLLLDIVIDGEKDGIDLAETINKDYCVPFIFLTANSDAKTISRAKQVNPYAYLVKPFNEQDLFTSIEIAISNFNAEQKAEPLNAESVAYLKDVIFIKEGELYHKVEINDILYIESGQYLLKYLYGKTVLFN